MAGQGFGSRKKRLFGVTHAHGKAGVRFYTQHQSVMQRWPESIAQGGECMMPTAR